MVQMARFSSLARPSGRWERRKCAGTGKPPFPAKKIRSVPNPGEKKGIPIPGTGPFRNGISVFEHHWGYDMTFCRELKFLLNKVYSVEKFY